MVIKILNSGSQDFHGVKYNDKKISNGDGELVTMKNFPSFITKESPEAVVRGYLKDISEDNNIRVRKPQFHAVLSTKYQEHTKEELAEIAEEIMTEMGYGKQPYLVVFHNDTDNNHIHIVSSRVNKDTGRKIDDSFEKLKSQRALSNAMEKIYGIKSEKELKVLLKYNIGSKMQLETLLKREGFKLVPNKIDESQFDILKNGLKEKTLGSEGFYGKKENIERKKQLRAIFHKYKGHYSNQVFRVIDNRAKNGRADESVNKNEDIKIEFESELQHNFRKLFGVDIVFHNKDDKDPFGYTIIDHKMGSVFKGSEIIKMKELFEFTSEKIDKKTYEKIKEYNVSNNEEKECLLKQLNQQNKNIKDFMIYQNRNRVKFEDYKALKKDVISFIKDVKQRTDNISIVKSERGNYFAIYPKYNHIQELKSLVGESVYEQFVNPGTDVVDVKDRSKDSSESIFSGIDKLLREFGRSEFTKTDPAEKELKKKRKKKRR